MNEKGYSFQSVHDSYWSHAATCNELNTELRQAFYDIHKHNLIDDYIDLSKNYIDQTAWPKRFNLERERLGYHFGPKSKLMENAFEKQKLYVSVPDRGELDIAEVLNAKYFFC